MSFISPIATDANGNPKNTGSLQSLGKDEFLLGLAEQHPERLYLGIDYSRPRTRSYLRKIGLRKLTNVRVLFEHAANALQLGEEPA